MTRLLLLLAVLLATPAAASAQAVNHARLAPGTDLATLTTGTEHGLMLGLGYARVLALAGRPVVVGGDLTLGWAEVDLDDHRARAGAQVPITLGGRWRLAVGLTGLVRGTENTLARMTNLGVDVAVVAGRFAPRGLVALELGLDHGLATRVEHRDAYLRFFPGARDRWIGNPGSTVRAGLQGGLTLGRVDLILRAGRLLELTGDAPMLPFYGTLTVDTRW